MQFLKNVTLFCNKYFIGKPVLIIKIQTSVVLSNSTPLHEVSKTKQKTSKYYKFIEVDKPYEMLRLIFLLVASLVRTSLRIDIVEMLSDLKIASPFLDIKEQMGYVRLTEISWVPFESGKVS